jgi:FkbM family methyltransferase
MKLFGRPLVSYTRNFKNLPELARATMECFRLVKNPVRFMWHYVTKTSPASRMVRFRDGLTIHLPGDPEDIVTIFLVFMRHDYGYVPKGSTVVDIGANIGVFSLYAAHQGAARVIACEPGYDTCELLRHNIHSNGLETTITVVKEAVTDVPGKEVRFPLAANANSRIAQDLSQGPTEVVRTTSLNELVERYHLQDIALLKMDCEGAEYPILLTTPKLNLKPVRALRMEYHEGRIAELEKVLAGAGMHTVRHTATSSVHGMLCCERRAA